jgi:hypothetical protein
MRLPKFRSVVLVGALLGIVAPLLFFTWHRFQEYIACGSGAFLWPSVIWLMATDRHEHELSAYLIIGMSVAANVLLYVLVFSLIWCVVWVLRAWRASLRDGTTI